MKNRFFLMKIWEILVIVFMIMLTASSEKIFNLFIMILVLFINGFFPSFIPVIQWMKDKRFQTF